MGGRDQLRFAVGAAQNRNLFPVHFLTRRLPDWPEYAAFDPTEIQSAIGAIWERERELLATFNEEQTEDRLIRPILNALGFSYTPRPNLPVGGRRREPDYALYLDEEERRESEALGGGARYAKAVAVLEAKRFDRPLDRRGASGALSEDPVAQIIHYVGVTKVPFGILTNGRLWRLYAERGDLVEGAYYEVDLVALLESGDPNQMRTFAAFFSADAFRPDASGRSFLDRALDESHSNAVAVGDALQERVFAAVPRIARGLLGDDEPTDENLAMAFEHALVFLYRLLFCLHAEARGLLPVDSPHYREYSVRRQREELAAALDGGRKFGSVTSRLYNELEALFKLVDSGDLTLGVNEYNGGLFSPSAHPWLEGRSVPDFLLAPALDGLYRLNGQMIDYRDLSIRHLGTIYERLLAYQLSVNDNGDLALVPAGGRKETGSYFTPEPIVDLIVERTLDPILERRSAEIAERKLEGDAALEAFLSIRVVDPAMGSGHFLVSAAAYIAQFIATDPSYNGDLDWREIQRLVAERCLYGVDLNPMAVELARLALWLATVTGDEPLTFLGNLRVGNSLVGADIDDLRAEEATFFTERLARDADALLAKVNAIAASRSESGSAVHEKERIAQAADALRGPLREFADDAIAPHFSGHVEMFHWELEFPEVFLAADGSLRRDRGFDAVLGNPPYIRIQQMDRELAAWCRKRFGTVAFGSFDAYIVFIDRAFGLLRSDGRLGFIVPNKFLKLDAGKKLRASLAEGGVVEEIVDFGDAQLFEGATNYTCVLILDASGRDQLAYRRIRRDDAGLPSGRDIDRSVPERFELGALGNAPWILTAPEERRLLDAITAGSVPLVDATRAIFQGLITSADPVYILEDRGMRPEGRLVYSRASERELLLEPDLLHPLASGAQVARYAFQPLGDLLLFPYRRINNQMGLVSWGELERLPLTAAYLREHEEALRGRERGKMDRDGWYGYVYPKSLGLHSLPKLGVPRLCERLRASIDPIGTIYLDNVDVNGVLPRCDGPDLWVLACLLNSSLLDYVFRVVSVPFRGNFLSANKQFIAPLPIRVPEGDLADAIVAAGQRLHAATRDLFAERRGFLAWLGDMAGVPGGSLPGRTKLSEPEVQQRTEILRFLRRGRAALGVDPESRSFRDRLAAEHASLVDRTGELRRRIERDEAEVDEAVFELYELAKAQRAQVEAAR